MLYWRPGTAGAALAPGETRVWLVELDAGLNTEDEVDSTEPGQELASLSPDEQARAARFVRARERRRFARCRAALREILGGLLGEPPSALKFRARAKGKPELDSPASRGDLSAVRVDLRFNVSHSSELAMIAVCLGRELGVDLERVRPIAEADRIVASFFSPVEQAEFAVIADDVRSATFLRGWTRKEAILKGLGVGLAGLAAHYETGFAVSDLTPEFRPAVPSPRVQEWQLWEAAPRAGFVAALAVNDA
jgi:4'-phosphopantetheinyl transferase